MSGRRATAVAPVTDTAGARRACSPRSRWTLPIASGAGFLAGLDTTAVNLALPDVQRDLDAGLTELQWVVNAFALLSASLLVVAGNLSDRYGPRRVFVTGLLGFAGASGLCGLAWSPLALDLARAAQGATTAVVLGGGFALLAHSYPAGERGRALGLYSSIASASFVIGPLLGGVLTDTVGWRAVFVVNVPVAALLAGAAAALVAEPSLRGGVSPVRFDPLGVLTFVIGIAGLQYAALRAQQVGWGDPVVLVSAAAGLLGLAAFFVVERRNASGFVDLELFRRRTFTGAAITIALGSAAYFGILVYLSLFLQSAQHYTALETGLIYLPTILPFMLISPLAGRLLAWLPGATVPAVGCALIAAGLVLLTQIGSDAGLRDVAPAMVVTGFGSGLVVAPLTKLALDQVPDGRAGMAGAVLQTVRPLGVTLGVTVLGVAIPGRVDADAFRSVAALAAALAVLAAVVAGGTIRADPRVHGGD
jgi:EmrB/QacA subfamily drug resistance transporter